jgi:phosphatidylserine/phosphatidylglycerophosphate/cardiolipin synthase-like enzyme
VRAMIHEHQQIGAAAARLAGRLPHSLMVCVAEAVAQHGSLESAAARRAILHCVPTPDFRDATAEFLHLWHTKAGSVGAEAVAVALVTAAQCEHDHRHEETVEIVWTGPEPAETRFRQTEQAILEVVNSATKKLTVVSYAVYRIPRIREALVAAASRGVGIRLIVETPNRIEGQGEYDCLLALGDDVASACSMYYWPQENRPKDDNGKIGILHVKCAVADGHRMFLSSANFTEYAFTINMELGLLVTGGKLPCRVERHFDGLLAAGVLVKV